MGAEKGRGKRGVRYSRETTTDGRSHMHACSLGGRGLVGLVEGPWRNHPRTDGRPKAFSRTGRGYCLRGRGVFMGCGGFRTSCFGRIGRARG